MTSLEIKELLKTEQYDFLRNHKYLGDNIMLLTLGGSIAYGTNLPTSDVDVRGIALNPPKQIYGLHKDFEQIVETNTDTVIYSLNKMIKLLTDCNPNTIEILGCKPEHYLYVNKYGQMVLDNKKNFLSKIAIERFGGYARSQYNRLEHALLGNGENDEKKLEMLKHSMECALNSFNIQHRHTACGLSIRILSEDEYKEVITNRYEQDKLALANKLASRITEANKLLGAEKEGRIQSACDLYRNDMEELEINYLDKLEDADNAVNERIVITGDFSKYPVGDIQTLLRDFHKIKSEYGNINKRNNKKDAPHMAKHMMHLIRLYKMGTKLNTSMEIQTYWDGKDRDELMYIRLGNFMTGDGLKVKSEFWDYHREVQAEYEYSVKHTILPDNPNIDALNDMMFNIYKEAAFR